MKDKFDELIEQWTKERDEIALEEHFCRKHNYSIQADILNDKEKFLGKKIFELKKSFGKFGDKDDSELGQKLSEYEAMKAVLQNIFNKHYYKVILKLEDCSRDDLSTVHYILNTSTDELN